MSRWLPQKSISEVHRPLEQTGKTSRKNNFSTEASNRYNQTQLAENLNLVPILSKMVFSMMIYGPKRVDLIWFFFPSKHYAILEFESCATRCVLSFTRDCSLVGFGINHRSRQ